MSSQTLLSFLTVVVVCLVCAAAACVAALRDPAWRHTAAGNARRNLEARFTWEATARRFLALATESVKGTCG